MAGSSDVEYTSKDAVGQIRQILKEGPQHDQPPRLNDNGLKRCIFRPVDTDGFIKQREQTKCVRVNFTNRRIVDPALLGLPEAVKISSVPWGYVPFAIKEAVKKAGPIVADTGAP